MNGDMEGASAQAAEAIGGCRGCSVEAVASNLPDVSDDKTFRILLLPTSIFQSGKLC